MDPCFREVNSQVSIDLHPSKLRDVAGSVRDQLCALLLTFREELCGVVLAFSGARIETRSPLVHAFFPYFHVDVSAKLQVLRLEPAQRMVGVLQEVAVDYVGLLVLGAFNAVIHKRDMLGHFKFDHQAGYWVHCRDENHKLQKGTSVRFVISSIDQQGRQFIVRGSLQHNDCGNAEICVPGYRPHADHGAESGLRVGSASRLSCADAGAHSGFAALQSGAEDASLNSERAAGAHAASNAALPRDRVDAHAAASASTGVQSSAAQLNKKEKKAKKRKHSGAGVGQADDAELASAQGAAAGAVAVGLGAGGRDRGMDAAAARRGASEPRAESDGVRKSRKSGKIAAQADIGRCMAGGADGQLAKQAKKRRKTREAEAAEEGD